MQASPSDDEAISEVVGFVLVFFVVSVIVLLALVGFGDVRDREVRDAAQDEAQAIGQRVSAVVTDMADWAIQNDDANGDGALEGASSLLRQVELPRVIAGHGYQISLSAAGVLVDVPSLGVRTVVEAYLPPGVDLCATTTVLNGGTVAITYNSPGACATAARINLVYP